MTRVTLRKFWAVTACVSLLSAAACSSGKSKGAATSASTPAGGASASNPIKIGVMGYMTGPSAQTGQEQLHAATVEADLVNAQGGVLGRQIQVIPEDIGSTSAQAIQDFRTLHSAGVTAVVGFNSSAICRAVGQVSQELDMTYVGQCSDPSMLGPDAPKNFFMAANIVTTYPSGAAALIKERFSDVKTWDVYSLDYVTGHSVASAFKQDLAKQVPSAQVGAQVFAPLAATDVRSYISSLEAAAPVGSSRGLFVYGYAGPALAFFKQAEIAGLFNHYKVITGSISDDVLNVIGAKAPAQWSVYDFYPGAFDTPLYKKVAAKWQELYHAQPPWEAMTIFSATQAVIEAIRKANSTDGSKIAAAMDGLTFNSVKGPITIKNHYFIQPAASFFCKGDASAPNGWSCSKPEVVPASTITPPDLLK